MDILISFVVFFVISWTFFGIFTYCMNKLARFGYDNDNLKMHRRIWRPFTVVVIVAWCLNNCSMLMPTSDSVNEDRNRELEAQVEKLLSTPPPPVQTNLPQEVVLQNAWIEKTAKSNAENLRAKERFMLLPDAE